MFTGGQCGFYHPISHHHHYGTNIIQISYKYHWYQTKYHTNQDDPKNWSSHPATLWESNMAMEAMASVSRCHGPALKI